MEKLVLRKSYEGFSAGTRVYLANPSQKILPTTGMISLTAWCDKNYMFEVPVEDIVKRRSREPKRQAVQNN